MHAERYTTINERPRSTMHQYLKYQCVRCVWRQCTPNVAVQFHNCSFRSHYSICEDTTVKAISSYWIAKEQSPITREWQCLSQFSSGLLTDTFGVKNTKSCNFWENLKMRRNLGENSNAPLSSVNMTLEIRITPSPFYKTHELREINGAQFN